MLKPYAPFYGGTVLLIDQVLQLLTPPLQNCLTICADNS